MNDITAEMKESISKMNYAQCLDFRNKYSPTAHVIFTDAELNAYFKSHLYLLRFKTLVIPDGNVL